MKTILKAFLVSLILFVQVPVFAQVTSTPIPTIQPSVTPATSITPTTQKGKIPWGSFNKLIPSRSLTPRPTIDMVAACNTL